MTGRFDPIPVFRCPRCGTPKFHRDLFNGWIRNKILDALRQRPMSTKELFEYVHGDDPDEVGPYSLNSMSEHISTMRAKLEILGFNIVATGGPGSKYVLTEIEK